MPAIAVSDAARFVSSELADALKRMPEAARLHERMLEHCGLSLLDIVDHLALPATDYGRFGWTEFTSGVWRHDDGVLPDIVEKDRSSIAIRVECVERALKCVGVDAPIEGQAHAPFRRARVFTGAGAALDLVERHGWQGFEAMEQSTRRIRRARIHQQIFRSRRRHFRSAESGYAESSRLIAAAVADLGPEWACSLFLRAEREYWQTRCAAGMMQRRRQDRVGLGWANVDHHAICVSRERAHLACALLRELGLVCTRRLPASDTGADDLTLVFQGGGVTVLVELDAAAREEDRDAGVAALSPPTWRRRAGLWCALHGEALLEGGLCGLAVRGDAVAIRRCADRDAIELIAGSRIGAQSQMQTLFCRGDVRAVHPTRVDELERDAYVSPEAANEIRFNGAIATHLLYVQRDGHFGYAFSRPHDGVENAALQVEEERRGRNGSRRRVRTRRRSLGSATSGKA